MAENVKDSYRMGIELAFGAKFNDWLRWDINGTWSKNRIKDYMGYVYDESLVNGEIVDNLWTQTAIKRGNSPISFSPSFIGNSLITLGSNGLEISLQSQYVSRQYLDNFGTKENSLDAYFVSHLSASYSFKTRHTKGITIGATVYNLFDTKYETNGYSQSVALYENGDKTKPYVTKHDPRFYPMAGTNILTHITFRF